MKQFTASVACIEKITADILVITFNIPFPLVKGKAGQFLHIRVSDRTDPFLRRPFSIYNQTNYEIKILFGVVGRGTSILAQKKIDEKLDILGPLGNPFRSDGEFDTALIVSGGLGVAPMPLLTAELKNSRKQFVTYVGARNSEGLLTRYLENIQTATDDGSCGFRGTVVDLLRLHLAEKRYRRPKIFGCGPIPMLNSLCRAAKEFDIPCEVSLEGMMACGLGICQGCPVEMKGPENKYAMVCKDGPVFNVGILRIPING